MKKEYAVYKDEIKDNEFVRTDEGYIAKYIRNTDKLLFDSKIQDISNTVYEEDNFLWNYEIEHIVKHSKNIKDLVEAGDYVNGLEVYKGKVANGKEKLLVGSYMINGMALEVVNIKTIVTKEQFASLEYRI